MHQLWLQRTLQLAKKRQGFCAPNPSVGAVAVKNNQVIAEGYHFAPGYPHAEIEALNQVAGQASGADLYVSLEPCCHYGRTPPCTERIKAEGIRAVYFSFLDPNPLVAGKGQEALIEAGIICKQIALPEIDQFYEPYAYWTNHQMPWVTAKLAMTADGYIATVDRKPIAITGEACQQLTHEYRRQSDAILSTIETILADDPKFNVRLNEEVVSKPIYLLDSQCRLPINKTIFDTAESITIFHDFTADVFLVQRLVDLGVRCISIDVTMGRLNLYKVLKEIGHDGMHTLWVEAGARCFSAFFQQKLLHRAVLYQSKQRLGKMGLPADIELSLLKQEAKSVEEKLLDNDRVFVFQV